MNLYQHSQSPHSQIVELFEHNRASVAALHEATVHASVPQFMEPVQKFSSALDAMCASVSPIYRFDGLSKDLRFSLGRAAVAVLPKVMFPASVFQLNEHLQKFSNTLDAMRASVSPFHQFDLPPKGPVMPPEIDTPLYAKGWNKHSEEPDSFVPTEPIISDAAPVGDDLTKEHRRSNLSDADGLIQAVTKLARAFRNRDFAYCLDNTPLVLKTLAQLISNPVEIFNFLSEAVACLQKSGYITKEIERWILWVAVLLSLFFK